MVRYVAKGLRRNSEIEEQLKIVEQIDSQYWAMLATIMNHYAKTQARIAEAITGEGAMAATDTDTVIASTEE
jgi:N-glycosylase/DNA lyase